MKFPKSLLCLLLYPLQKGALSSDAVIGQGNTTAWKICGLDRSTCLTVFFDISPSERSNQSGIPNPQLYIQFLTKYGIHSLCIISSLTCHVRLVFRIFLLFIRSYQNPEGQMRLRVTTITRKWVEGSANTAVSSQTLEHLLSVPC